MEKIPPTPEISNFFQPEDPMRLSLTDAQKAEQEKFIKENLKQARLAYLNIQMLVGPLDSRWKQYDRKIATLEYEITGNLWLKPKKSE